VRDERGAKVRAKTREVLVSLGLALGPAHKSAAFPRDLSGDLLRFADPIIDIEDGALTREERPSSELYRRRRA
jgi:hypothetical protein